MTTKITSFSSSHSDQGHGLTKVWSPKEKQQITRKGYLVEVIGDLPLMAINTTQDSLLINNLTIDQLTIKVIGELPLMAINATQDSLFNY